MLSIAVFQSLKALAVNVAVVVVSKTIRRSILAETEYVQDDVMIPGLILGLRPANERRRYKVTPSLIGWVQTSIWPCVMNTLSALLSLCKGDPPVPGGFPTQRDSNVKLWYFCCYTERAVKQTVELHVILYIPWRLRGIIYSIVYKVQWILVIRW